MLQMGDEIRRTQRGNNNAYCQDNETSWFNWDETRKHQSLLRFTKGIIAFTQELALFRQERFWALGHKQIPPHVVWHGTRLEEPDWSDHSHSLAIELHAPEHDERLYIALNAYWEPLTFQLRPLQKGQHWYRIVDTGLQSPDDFNDMDNAPIVDATTYTVRDRSSIILLAR